MLVSPETWLPASRCEDVLGGAARRRSPTCARAETHGSALELATPPHAHGRRRGSAAGRRCAARARRTRSTSSGCARRPPARTRRRAGRTSRSPRAPATSSCTRRCASWRGASRRSGCTSTSPCPTAEAALRALNAMRGHLPRAARAVGQLAVLAGPRQRARVGAHAGLPGVPAHRPAALVRTTTPTTSRRSTCSCAATRSPSRRSCGGTRGCSRASARSRCGSWTRRRACEDTAAIATLVQCLVRLEAEREPREPSPRTRRGAEREPLHRRARRDGRRAGRAAGVEPAAGARPARGAARRVRAARARARLRERAGARRRGWPTSPGAARASGARWARARRWRSPRERPRARGAQPRASPEQRRRRARCVDRVGRVAARARERANTTPATRARRRQHRRAGVAGRDVGGAARAPAAAARRRRARGSGGRSGAARARRRRVPAAAAEPRLGAPSRPGDAQDREVEPAVDAHARVAGRPSTVTDSPPPSTCATVTTRPSPATNPVARSAPTGHLRRPRGARGGRWPPRASSERRRRRRARASSRRPGRAADHERRLGQPLHRRRAGRRAARAAARARAGPSPAAAG